MSTQSPHLCVCGRVCVPLGGRVCVPLWVHVPSLHPAWLLSSCLAGEL